jgi:hypothetical protein
MKTKPTLSGVVQTDDADPKRRENVGKIALWPNESGTSKAPKFRGILETEKGKFRVSLWDNEEKGEKSPSLFDGVKITGTGEFFCRYCKKMLAEFHLRKELPLHSRFSFPWFRGRGARVCRALHVRLQGSSYYMAWIRRCSR